MKACGLKMLDRDSATLDHLNTENLLLLSPLLISIKDFSHLLDLLLKSLEAINPASFSSIVSISSGPSSTS